MRAGSVAMIPSTIPGREVDDRPLPIGGVVAFPKLKWSGWNPVSEDGKAYPLRPLLLTHAGDGSGRNFVIVQQGTIHGFPNRDDATETKVFLDIQDRRSTTPTTKTRWGLLGLAFHPKYKENREFFVYYTLKGDKLTNVISRFRVSNPIPTRRTPRAKKKSSASSGRSGTTPAERSSLGRTVSSTSCSATAAPPTIRSATGRT